MAPASHKSKIPALVLSIAGITILHYTTGPNLHFQHDVYQRLYYLPIIFASFWYGLRGGITTSIVVSVIYAVHIVIQLETVPSRDIERFLELLLYNIVGGVTGYLAGKEKKLRVRHQETAEKLADSYRRLEEQTGKLLEIEEQMRRADRLSTLGELAAGMAHELRNPLASIKGTSEILKADFRPGDRKYEFIAIMIKEVERLNRVVEDFLRFARPVPLQATDVDLERVVASVIHLVRNQATDIDIEIVPFLTPPVRADKERLVQVFLNLALNALQSMTAGGRLVISAEIGEGKVNIYFKDTGKGISEEEREKIFKPFFTTKQSGTGLGLAISRRIIEAHGGSLMFDSEHGKGTTFIVSLPVV